ncbi:MAG TPA: ATP-binding protein, partial [Kiloniellaceae bacterium]
STMICNDLIMPALLRISWLRMTERGDLSSLLIAIRRGAIVLILLLAFAYFRFIGQPEALVTIGLVSFAAAAQFAPAIVGGIFWKGGSRQGALAGLTLGFVAWVYTLLLPSFARPGWLATTFIEQGPFGIELLRPYALFGLQGLDSLSHALFWSMLANIGGYVIVSLLSRQSAIERIQAVLFVDVFRHSGAQGGTSHFWRGSATVPDLKSLLARFIGLRRAERAFADYGRAHGLNVAKLRDAESGLVSFTERILAGAIGAASARVMVASVAKGEVVGIEEVMAILEETSQVIKYSHGLEQKSRELEALAAELREANARLQELDRMKDEFLSTVSHELRTPLTSIRSFSEILFDNPDIGLAERRKFLTVIVKESERLTRLINQILDLAKMEAGSIDWEMQHLDPRAVIEEALTVTSTLFSEKSARLAVEIGGDLPMVYADRDRLIQVLVNLLSNAAKFCDERAGHVIVTAEARPEGLQISIADNGRGVPPENRELIFEKFQQASTNLTDKPRGTGLGLTISRQIIGHFGGRIWVEPAAGGGARFCVEVPPRPQAAMPQAV